MATTLAPEEAQRGQPGGFVQPAFENLEMTKAAGFLRQNHKYRLGNFLGMGGHKHVAERDGINQVHVPFDQYREGFLGFPPAIFPEQLYVIQFGHLSIYSRRRQKTYNYFAVETPLLPSGQSLSSGPRLAMKSGYFPTVLV